MPQRGICHTSFLAQAAILGLLERKIYFAVRWTRVNAQTLKTGFSKLERKPSIRYNTNVPATLKANRFGN